MRRPLIVLLLLLATPATARAGVVVGAAETAATGAIAKPALDIAPDGTPVLAFARADGIFVTDRTALGWLPAARLSDDAATPLLATGPDGTRVIGWSERGGGVRVAIARGGGLFGTPVAVDAGDLLALRVLTDGTVALGVSDRGHTRSVLTAAPGERFGEPHVLATGATVGSPLSLAVSGTTLTALWPAPEAAPDTLPNRIYSADRAPDGSWGATQALSPPNLNAYDGLGQPQVIANARGDELAFWTTQSRWGGPALPYSDGLQAVRRSAGGSWGEPQSLLGPNRQPLRPTAAIAPNGSAAVLWNAGSQLGTVYAAPNAPFGAERDSDGPGDSNEGTPIALFDSGRTVAVRGQHMEATTSNQLAVATREPDSCFTLTGGLLGDGVPSFYQQLALDAKGSGLVVWNDAQGRVRDAPISDDPAVAPAARGCTDAPTSARTTTVGRTTAAGPGVRLALGAARATRSTLRRRGLRITVTTGRRARVYVAVFATVRGRRVYASPNRRLGSLAGPKRVRLRFSSALSRVRPGQRLTVVAFAEDGRAASTATRTLRYVR